MKKLCSTEGHFYVRTTETCSKRCFYCGGIKWPWSVESSASLRAYAKLKIMARQIEREACVTPFDGVSLVSNVVNINRKEHHA